MILVLQWQRIPRSTLPRNYRDVCNIQELFMQSNTKEINEKKETYNPSYKDDRLVQALT
jgi:hypothetical protein